MTVEADCPGHRWSRPVSRQAVFGQGVPPSRCHHQRRSLRPWRVRSALTLERPSVGVTAVAVTTAITPGLADGGFTVSPSRRPAVSAAQPGDAHPGWSLWGVTVAPPGGVSVRGRRPVTGARWSAAQPCQAVAHAQPRHQPPAHRLMVSRSPSRPSLSSVPSVYHCSWPSRHIIPGHTLAVAGEVDAPAMDYDFQNGSGHESLRDADLT